MVLTHSQDPILQWIVEQAQKTNFIDRVYLFGSRARGDNNARSDYDIAIVALSPGSAEVLRWCEELRENVPSLCGLDIVILEKGTSDALKASIMQEGKVIYERYKT